MAHTRTRREAGMALVLALLALMLLTFLGLTLAATTSTELQIANNYRWSQQAFYNAEAGLEVGKKVLATVDWATLLYPPRGTNWDGYTAPTSDAEGGTSPADRNFENWQCDRRGNGAGYGRVLTDGATTYLDQTDSGPRAGNQPINGAFTIWVRRPLIMTGAGMYQDYTLSDQLILTAEGVAPYSDASGAGSLTGAQNRAARTMEIVVTSNLTSSTCGTYGGQAGGGPEGAGFGGCAPVDASSIGRSLGMAAAPVEAAGVR